MKEKAQRESTIGYVMSEYTKNDKSDRDPLIIKYVNHLLKKYIGAECCLVMAALLCAIFGSLPDYTNSYFVGQALTAMEDRDSSKFN